MNWVPLFGFHRTHMVDRLAEHIEHASKRLLADGHRDRSSSTLGLHATNETVGWLQRDGANASAAKVLRDLDHNVDRLWETWMQRHTRTYVPVAGQGPAGQRADDPMVSIVWPSLRPSEVLDPTEAGLDWYRYDRLAA